MFVGQHDHSLDDKGRVVLPATYRSSFEDRGFVTLLDGCIGLWSGDGFKEVADDWKQRLDNKEMSPELFRALMMKVRDVRLDAAGRMSLPRDLLEELNFGDQVTITGRWDRIEIWPREVFSERMNLTSDQRDAALRDLAI